MKLTINTEMKLTANVPKGSILLTASDGWITWYRITETGSYQVSTSSVADFECQNKTQMIELWDDEILKLAEIIQLPKRKKRH